MPGKQLLGMRVQLSVAAFNVTPLWQQFMPRRKAITQVVSDLLYSVSVYPPLYFEQFKPETTFEKWAAVEVSSLHSAPEDMEHLLLPGGELGTFKHGRGPVPDGTRLRLHPVSVFLSRLSKNAK